MQCEAGGGWGAVQGMGRGLQEASGRGVGGPHERKDTFAKTWFYDLELTRGFRSRRFSPQFRTNREFQFEPQRHNFLMSQHVYWYLPLTHHTDQKNQVTLKW